MVVFEGAAHPYKKNLVKVDGQLRDGYAERDTKLSTEEPDSLTTGAVATAS